MIFGKGERRRTKRTSNENLLKSTEIAAFWQGSYYSRLAWLRVVVIKIRPRFAIIAKRGFRTLTEIISPRVNREPP